MIDVLQLQSVVQIGGVAEDVIRIAGIGVLAMGSSALIAALYRWYSGEAVIEGLAMLFALAAAAVYLNARAALGEVAAGETLLLSGSSVLFNLSALGAAVVAAPVGRRIGDRLGRSVVPTTGSANLEKGVGSLAARIGRGTVITFPDEIQDMSDHEPVSQAVKDRLAGETLVFPSGVTGEALQERIQTRLKAEEGVAYVDVDVDADRVTYLALGATSPGLGPTLAPGSAAVALEGDPPVGAGSGDLVEVWGSDPASEAATPRRLATVELRSVANDVVTVVCDATDASTLAGGSYRLVTLPTNPAHDREFASILRSVEETMGVATVEHGSPLVGQPVGSVQATIVAVQPAASAVTPIPSRSRAIEAGDTLFAVARPDVLRRLEDRARTPSSRE